MTLTGKLIQSGLVALICWWLFLSTTVSAQKAIPALTSQVVDLAGMMSASGKANLIARLKAHEEKSGNQIAVLTVSSLQGDSLEDYSLKVARKWALGQKDVNNGVLFLIAKNDRKMRIEVGYGLESTLTDAIASFIIRQTVRPLFRQGLFNGGIEAGAGQIIEVLESDDAALQTWKNRANSKDGESHWPIYLFVAIWLMIFFGGILSSFLVRTFGKQVKPGHYRWLGIDAGPNAPKPRKTSRSGYSSGGGSFGGGGGGFSGGGGSFGGGGSSGGW